MNSGAAFVWMDRHLDSTRTGPRYLSQEPVARAVTASLRRGVLLGHYDLAAYAILPNHMHLLVLPKIAPSRLLHSLKGASGQAGESRFRAHRGIILASQSLTITGCGMIPNGGGFYVTLRTTR